MYFLYINYLKNNGELFKRRKCWSKSFSTEINNKVPINFTGNRDKQLLLKILRYRAFFVCVEGEGYFENTYNLVGYTPLNHKKYEKLKSTTFVSGGKELIKELQNVNREMWHK